MQFLVICEWYLSAKKSASNLKEKRGCEFGGHDSAVGLRFSLAPHL